MDPSAQFGPCRDSTFLDATPLHWAAEQGHLEICRLTIDVVIDKNPADEYGDTPMHLAAENGHLEICRLIMRNVDDPNPYNEDDISPLHLAAGKGHLEICRLILDNIENKNPRGMGSRAHEIKQIPTGVAGLIDMVKKPLLAWSHLIWFQSRGAPCPQSWDFSD